MKIRFSELKEIINEAIENDAFLDEASAQVDSMLDEFVASGKFGEVAGVVGQRFRYLFVRTVILAEQEGAKYGYKNITSNEDFRTMLADMLRRFAWVAIEKAGGSGLQLTRAISREFSDESIETRMLVRSYIRQHND